MKQLKRGQFKNEKAFLSHNISPQRNSISKPRHTSFGMANPYDQGSLSTAEQNPNTQQTTE